MEYIKSIFNYNPITGEITSRVNRRKAKIGKILGCLDGSGYVDISICNKKYKAHRLAWLLYYGEWPKNQIDHVNGIKNDNRILNLRECSTHENAQNIIVTKRSNTGYLGVIYHKNLNKYEAQICFKGERHYLGFFNTPEEASNSYLNMKKELHKFNPVPRNI